MSASLDDQNDNFAAMLAKYDNALNLYDDLAKDISQMKKATQIVRQKTLKLLEAKMRKKKALSIQNDALDIVLSKGIKAQLRRKALSARKFRRRSASTSFTINVGPRTPLKSLLRRPGSPSMADKAVGPSVSLKVHFESPLAVPVRPTRRMSTRRMKAIC